jgi:hypothetical protein
MVGSNSLISVHLPEEKMTFICTFCLPTRNIWDPAQNSAKQIRSKVVVTTNHLAQHYFWQSSGKGKGTSMIMTASCGGPYPSPFCPMYSASKRTWWRVSQHALALIMFLSKDDTLPQTGSCAPSRNITISMAAFRSTVSVLERCGRTCSMQADGRTFQTSSSSQLKKL